MATARTFLLFGLVSLVSAGLVLGNILTVKCCTRDERLSSDLTACEPLTNLTNYNETSDNSSYVTEFTPPDSTEPVDDLSENSTASLEIFPWLPDFLWNETDEKPTVVFGQLLQCGDGRVFSLTIPRDENRFRWRLNGSLELRSRTTHGAVEVRLFEPEEFCADTFMDDAGEDRRAVLLCPCDRVRCVNKCCPPGQAIVCVEEECDCGEFAREWNPLHPDLPVPEEDFAYEVVVDDNVTCPDGWQASVDGFTGYPFYLVRDWWEKLWEERNLCGDLMSSYAGERQGLVRCMRMYPFPGVAHLSHWLHVPEALLLALALATFLAAPRRRLSVHSHVHDLAMFWHAAALFARSLLWPPFTTRFQTKCWHVPIAIYFFSIAASFWLNVICINMVVGFWNPQGARGSGSGAARKAMLLYSLYAWGASAIMTVFMSVMWYARDVPSGWIRPTLHETRTCFREGEAQGKLASFAYYYGPISALLLVNALLFFTTVVRVRQLSSHAKSLRTKSASSISSGGSKDGAASRQERSMIIYVKLLWLMGVVEMGMEIATWASDVNEFYIAIVGSLIDLLRGAAIFYMCCCNRRTLRALRERADKSAAVRALRRWLPQRAAGDAEDQSRSGGKRSSSSASETSNNTQTSEVVL